MLTGAGALHRQRARDHALIETARLRHLFGAIRIDHEDKMKVPIPDMTDERRWNRRSREVLLGLADAFSKPGNRHTHIGRPALRTWTQRQRGVISIVPRLP